MTNQRIQKLNSLMETLNQAKKELHDHVDCVIGIDQSGDITSTGGAKYGDVALVVNDNGEMSIKQVNAEDPMDGIDNPLDWQEVELLELDEELTDHKPKKEEDNPHKNWFIGKVQPWWTGHLMYKDGSSWWFDPRKKGHTMEDRIAASKEKGKTDYFITYDKYQSTKDPDIHGDNKAWIRGENGGVI